MVQSFGGSWSNRKLSALKEYLLSYLRIMNTNERAKYFRTIYVDGFAGSGRFKPNRKPSRPQQSELDLSEYDEAAEFAIGSATMALELEARFDEYIFIEKGKRNRAELSRLREQHPDLNVSILPGDANEILPKWAASLKPLDRAVVFLDPYGMQVDWNTIQCLGKTKKVDLWLLVPSGQALQRVLCKREIPEAWAARITRFFGREDWLDEFYPVTQTTTLFGPFEQRNRQVNLERLKTYMKSRLEKDFSGVLDSPIPLSNSNGLVLFHLFFAVGNPKGVKPALRIAQSVSKKFSQKGGR